MEKIKSKVEKLKQNLKWKVKKFRNKWKKNWKNFKIIIIFRSFANKHMFISTRKNLTRKLNEKLKNMKNKI